MAVRRRDLVEIIADHERQIKRMQATLARVGSGAAGVTDHGGLTGLTDDDHGHYLTNARGDARYSLLAHGHALDLEGLDDVTLNAIGGDEILKWNGTQWINNTLAEAGIAAVGDLHTKYTDGEAVSAVGTPWVGLIAAEDHHTKYTDGEVDAIVATHDAIASAHHSKYTDSEAAAKIAADDLYLKIAGDTMGGDLNMGGSDLLNVGYLSTLSVADYGLDYGGVWFRYGVAGATDKPTGTDHAVMTMAYSTAWSVQMAGDWRTNKFYTRGQNNGVWGSWDELAHTSDLHTKYTDGEVDAIVLTHKNLASAHHSKYTDGEVDAIVLTHKNLASAHHTKYTDGEVDSIVATHTALASAHHSKYTDGNAVSAMGVLGNGNALNHTRYSDANAVSAVGTPWVGLIAAEDHHTKYTDSQAAAKIASDALYALTGHTIVSHDTTATGSNLNTLTGGGNADALHGHAGSGAPDMDSITDVTISAVTTGEVLQKSAGDWINQTLSEAGILALAGGTMTGAILGPNGLVGAPSYSFASDPDTGIYRTAPGALGLVTDATLVLDMVASGIYPKVQFRHISGNAGAPPYAFSSDGDTGMYSGGTNILSFSQGGNERMRLDSGGSLNVGVIGTTGMALIRNSAGTAASPTYGFQGDPDTGMFRLDDNRIAFSTAGQTRFHISGSGNFYGVLTTGVGMLRGALGTVSAPAHSFYGDPNTGMYWISADRMGFAVGGVKIFDMRNDDRMYVSREIRMDGAGSNNEITWSAGAAYHVGLAEGWGLRLTGGGNHPVQIHQNTAFTVGVSATGGAFTPKYMYQSGWPTTGASGNLHMAFATGSTYYFLRSTSARRYKTDITPASYLADIVLEPSHFYREDDDLWYYGFIADDLADQDEMLGVYGEDGEIENYDDRTLMAVMAAKINRLEALVEGLTGKPVGKKFNNNRGNKHEGRKGRSHELRLDHTEEEDVE